ncbi:metallo-beta-lactamase superfamily protein [Cordyceps fumosorosea ARSEF 2679]|uniref:Metallo-beta-lactamase superfamily protein n=1 Tax=Cordyceps fumosorosea (strain ARSEF 2679) TaxID=1081104 RepID=A0A167V8A6_CORFA|nr:metallo-beta-lactamase superfamily protein [Cordyceps fumosorosea ARSEF 2679]OAA62339.1 metallo-beta-lactamase superfamily protein [Cordyceps fumosorosea ARSEF 2679]
MSLEPIVHPVFEKVTATWQYIVACPETKRAAIIDPVLDFDPSTLTLSTASADSLLRIVREHNYVVDLLLETHAHADHLTAAGYLQRQLHRTQGGSAPPATATGHRIRGVQERFAAAYHVPRADLDAAFERLFADDEPFLIGRLPAVALHLPGHTPDHSGYRVGDAHVFVGDSLFLPDVGTARCDFPDGDAATLFGSAAALLALPPTCRLYAGHDYPPAGSGREPRPWATVEEQRARNKHVKEGTGLEEFVRWREGRDKGLGEPRLLHPALQTNVRGGKLAETKTGSGVTMLSLPVKMPGNF